MIPKFAIPPLFGACLVASAFSSAAASTRPVFLIHGNYCGPGNRSPLAPTDALDAACARHDACTPDGGLPTKACNMRLQREADDVANDPRQSASLRIMAGLVASGAAMMPFASPGTRDPRPGPLSSHCGPDAVRHRISAASRNEAER